MEFLPKDIVCSILKEEKIAYRMPQLLVLMLVSKSWKKMVLSNKLLFERMYFNNKMIHVDRMIGFFIKHSFTLLHLCMVECAFAPKASCGSLAGLVERLPSLQGFFAYTCDFEESFWTKHIELNTNNVTAIQVAGNTSSFTNEALNNITRMFGASLKSLELSGCSLLTDQGLKVITRCENLETLDLGDLGSLNGTCLETISKKCTKLEQLDLYNGWAIQDEAFENCVFPNLTYLNCLECHRLTDTGLAYICNNFQSLEYFRGYLIDSFTPAGYDHFLNLKNLTELELLECAESSSEASCSIWGQMTHLKTLSIGAHSDNVTNVTKEALAKLVTLTNLKSLKISFGGEEVNEDMQVFLKELKEKIGAEVKYR